MKTQKFIYSIFILSLTCVVMFIGCQKEDTFYELNDRETYLTLSSNVNFDKLTKEDLEIISLAFFRLNIRENEYGLLEIVQKKGKDINISEELFNYFQSIAESNNKKIMSEIRFTRSSISTREEIEITYTDCVARSIVYATGLRYEDVNSWITNTYGSNGVPSNQFYFTMNHFCDNGAQVPLSMFNAMDITGDSNNKYVIVINGVHAVNIVAKTGSDILYYDAQTGGYGFCTTPNVTHIYEIR